MIQQMADYLGVSPQALLIGLAFFAVYNFHHKFKKLFASIID